VPIPVPISIPIELIHIGAVVLMSIRGLDVTLLIDKVHIMIHRGLSSSTPA
jgi:hypothetical protein